VSLLPNFLLFISNPQGLKRDNGAVKMLIFYLYSGQFWLLSLVAFAFRAAPKNLGFALLFTSSFPKKNCIFHASFKRTIGDP
jgi:hypothetical protein